MSRPDSSVFAPTQSAPAPLYLFIQTLAVCFALGLLVYRFLNQLVPNPFSVLVLQSQNFSNSYTKQTKRLCPHNCLRHHFPAAKKRDLCYVQPRVWVVFNCTVISLDEETVTMSLKDSFHSALNHLRMFLKPLISQRSEDF